MAQYNKIEEEIREILAHETDAITLSNKLFSPNGLFNELANTVEERRAVARTPLFKEAQHRLTELQSREAAAFRQTVEQAQSGASDKGSLYKRERLERV